MALSKDVLGQALYDMRHAFFNDKTIEELEQEYGSLEQARVAACKKEAEIIIDHFKANIQITVPGAGLVAPSGGGPVTGTSTTGSIT